MMSDAGDQLIRALRAELASFGGTVTLEKRINRPWASITFSGARHSIALRLGGPGAAAAADAFLGGLPDREFTLRGHILADIALISDRRGGSGEEVRLILEALTVEVG